jgi:hypothetical protein
MNTRALSLAAFAVVFTLCATQAFAQAPAPPPPDDPDTLPIPKFVVDARGVIPRFKQNTTIAEGLKVSTANLPTRGLGLVVGAHWYPLHAGVVTFGIGGEWMDGRASRTLDPTPPATEPSPTVKARLSAISPQVSLNFGKRNGWSYLSGGIGRSTYTTEREDAPLPDPESGSKTINYGGGARWFVKKHLAFAVDLRFYAINPQDATAERPAVPRMTLMMLSAGVAFR